MTTGKAGAVLATALILSTGCALFKSDKATVGDFVAARIYHEDRYERECVTKIGPPGCLEMRDWLTLWKHLNTVANDVQRIGTLPAEEKKELRRVWRKVEALP